MYLEGLEKEKSSSRDTPESGVSRFGIPFWNFFGKDFAVGGLGF